MTKTEQMALIYGLSIAGAAVVSYRRGRRGFGEVGTDAAVHGGIVGTGVNVVMYLHEDFKAKTSAVAIENQGQKDCSTYGKLASKGVGLLSAINPDVLYKAAKLTGLSIGPEGDNPNIVQLPKE
jgi:hypothetical protein